MSEVLLGFLSLIGVANIVIIIYGYGKLSQKIDDLRDDHKRLEERFFIHISSHG